MTTPFDLNNEAAYQAWKQNKLAGYPTTLGELLVEIKDPFALTAGEKEAILSRCATFDGRPPLSQRSCDRN